MRATLGCVLLLILWGALFAAYTWLFLPLDGWFPALMLALFGSVGVFTFFGGLAGLLRSPAVVRALGRDATGARLADGKLEAVSGQVAAVAEPLRSPFSGREAIAYEYDVTLRGREEGTPLATGIAMAPGLVRGRRGEVRILGFPSLERLEKKPVEPEDPGLARAFLDSVRWEELSVGRSVHVLRSLIEAYADEDGRVQKDWRSEAALPDAPELAFFERLLAPGELVTLVGPYDARQRAFAPKQGATIELVPGTAEAARSTLVTGQRTGAVFGIVWGVLAHGFLAIAWVNMPEKRDLSAAWQAVAEGVESAKRALTGVERVAPEQPEREPEE